MARGNDINQRIVLTGADEVRRQLEEIAASGQQAGNTTRAALIAATSGANTFTAGTRAAGASSGQMRFALQNLSFQVNDVATSLASGGDVMRVFAQQGGQVFQAFQQGGGLGNVLGAAGTAIGNFITPMRLAAAGALALAAGLAIVIVRAVSTQDSIRGFDVILTGIGQSSQATGKQMEDVAEGLRNIGIGLSQARKDVGLALREGIKPQDVDKIVRAGADLNAVLGEGSLEKFVSAAAAGGPALEEFAKKLGINIPQASKEAEEALKNAAEAADRASQAFQDAFRQHNQALADEQLNTNRQIVDLTRKRGKAQEELEFASKRRIEDINRQHTRRLNELIRQRNAAAQKAIAEFNKIQDAESQKFADKQILTSQIINKVFGSANRVAPLVKLFRDIGVAWNGLINSLANTAAIQGVITALQAVVTAALDFAKAHPQIAAFAAELGAAGIAIGILLPIIGGLRVALLGLTAASGPWGLALAVVAGAILLIATNWDTVSKRLEEGWKIIKGAYDDGVKWISDKISSLRGWLQGLIDKAKEAASAIAGLFGGGGNAPPIAEAPIPPPAAQLAGGGLIRGPGTGTSDSIGAFLSNGEFVVNALATRMNLPILEAINAMAWPAMPRFTMPRGFAMGGLVGAGAGGGSPVYLTFPGGATIGPMMSDRQVRLALEREARKAGMKSAGKKPSTA